MSKRSIYLRDQADKCRAHASAIGERSNAKLAAEYVEQAALIESKEKPAGVTGGT
jgi:hypothetical protein